MNVVLKTFERLRIQTTLGKIRSKELCFWPHERNEGRHILGQQNFIHEKNINLNYYEL
jgi:hypothetical protein